MCERSERWASPGMAVLSGAAERAKVNFAYIRAALHGRSLQPIFWYEAIKCSLYLLAKSPAFMKLVKVARAVERQQYGEIK